ncbi:DUF3549 family protein [Variovorax gossypii]
MRSFTEIMKAAGTKYRVYDFGRHCQLVSNKSFEQYETGAKPYPLPFVNKALIIVVKDAQPGEMQFLQFDPIEIPLDPDGFLDPYATTRYAMAGLEAALHSEHRKFNRPHAWNPTWGEAFMAQAHFMRDAKREISQDFEIACERLLTSVVGWKTRPDFVWTIDLGVPELGVAEVVLLSEKDDRAQRALMHVLRAGSPMVRESLLGFMAHAPLRNETIELLGEMARKLVASRSEDLGLAAGLIQSLASSKDFNAMNGVVAPILESRYSSETEVLVRVVRYHRQLMGEHKPFEIASVLDPAARNERGPDVFDSFVLDMVNERNLAFRLCSTDFAALSPLTKFRLRKLAPSWFKRIPIPAGAAP